MIVGVPQPPGLETWKRGILEAHLLARERRLDAFVGNGAVLVLGGLKGAGDGRVERVEVAGERAWREARGLGSATPVAGSQRINVAFAILIGHGVFWRMIVDVPQLQVWKPGNLEIWKPTLPPERWGVWMTAFSAFVSRHGFESKRLHTVS